MLDNCYCYANKYIMHIYLKNMEEILQFPDPYWRAYDTKLTSRTEELYSKQTKIWAPSLDYNSEHYITVDIYGIKLFVYNQWTLFHAP